MSDGESGYSDTNLQTAKQKYVKIHTVGLGSSSYDIVLKNISSYTGGEFYKALTASELVDIYTDIGIGGDFDTTDTDGDGLYDAVEAAGMRLENGDIIYSDPTTKHSDTDGLEDGEEMDPTIHWKDVGSTAGYSRDKEYFFVMHSDPMKNDTDNDELSDKNDPNPRSSNNYSSFSISLNNSDKVTAIQRCLVYLGYLDMQGNDYGTCGGLTIAAIQLFQLNHRMYSDGDSLYSVDDVNYIDKNSYYSIFKEALDHGFSNCPSWVLDIVREPYFPDSYVPITLPLEEFNASLNPSNPCIISSVLRESIDTANKYNDLVDIYIYDYTPVMDRMLQSGAATFHAHHFDCNCTNSTLDPHIYTISYSNSGNVCGYNGSDYIWLVSVVKDDAAYDIKRKARWNDFMDGLNANVPFYHSAFPYAFRGQVINAEIMGNILFGFAGNAGGYSKWEFTTGGSIYSYITTGAADNSEDTYYIEYGFDLFDDYADDYNYLHF